MKGSDDFMGKEVKLYTVSEVANILRRHKRTVYLYIKHGELGAVRIGKRDIRIPEEDLKKFIEEGRIKNK